MIGPIWFIVYVMWLSTMCAHTVDCTARTFMIPHSAFFFGFCAAAPLAGTALYNAGQDCTAACRVFAPRAVYARVVEALAEAAGGLKSGALDDPDTELGPLVSARQRDRVAGFVERAAALPHGRVVAGGGAHRKRRR